ncbi:LPS export ABC transporter periplasmic protein LptC [Jannaschia sp. W003]|uniref:LPS export ABC transporter periplasmic protein LptC n=1 Tax=Jannaschia sp. W003 TaxID=2867012 RepID=UPI0021A7564C|nr:LPS export ABC transporter periplasmic protein LptC [Jannaschia sp. W003]UWQ22035.1 hypothetical protein K3554_03110 [Jannaschia sp. W003]
MIGDAGRARLVAGAKVALPVAALALLSTLFLVARTPDPEDALPFAAVDIGERATDQQLTTPRVMGRSQGGTAFDLRAARARPDPADPRRMTIDALHLELSGRGEATVEARAGTVDTAARTVVLEGDVAVDTATGYALRSDRLEGSLAELSLVSPGPVRGTSPLGRLRAGAMRLEERNGAARLVFSGGVDLLYVPPPPPPAPDAAAP